MKDVKDMTTEELQQAVREDFERFEAGCCEDQTDYILEVLAELSSREGSRTPPPFLDVVGVKGMTDEELVAIWEAALAAPIEEPVPEIVAEVMAELEDREAIE